MICHIDTELDDVSDQSAFFLFVCFSSLQWIVSQAGAALNSVSNLSGWKKKIYDKLESRAFQNLGNFSLETINNVLWIIEMFWMKESPQLWAQTMLKS